MSSRPSTVVLQSTMICIDNCEWTSPTRLQAQEEAVNLICGAKTQATMICIDNSEWIRKGGYSPTRFQSNPENGVGVLTMAGKGIRVLVTRTSDLGKNLACMKGKRAKQDRHRVRGPLGLLPAALIFGLLLPLFSSLTFLSKQRLKFASGGYPRGKRKIDQLTSDEFH